MTKDLVEELFNLMPPVDVDIDIQDDFKKRIGKFIFEKHCKDLILIGRRFVNYK